MPFRRFDVPATDPYSTLCARFLGVAVMGFAVLAAALMAAAFA